MPNVAVFQGFEVFTYYSQQIANLDFLQKCYKICIHFGQAFSIDVLFRSSLIF